MRIALTYNEKRSAAEHEAEFDTRATIESLVERLARAGHVVAPVDVGGSIPRLVQRLQRFAPDVVFDLAEGERGTFREAFYPALFEQLGIPFTGSSPSVRALCLDKWLAERVVAAAGVSVPGGVVVRSVDELALHALEPPLIVKPNFEGSSKGITSASVVRDGSIANAVAACLARYPEGALVEAYVEGIDVSVAWIDGLGWLPEIAFHHDRAIYDYALKHDTPERVRVEIPAAFSDTVRARVQIAARRTFTALGITGFGRADFRVTPRGDVVFLELNPLPCLTDGDLFDAAAAMGASADAVLACIVGSVRAPIREPCQGTRMIR